MSQDLTDYIKQSQARGLTREQISAELKKAGWQEGQILDGFKDVEGPGSVGARMAPQGSQKRTLVFAVIIALVLIGGGAGAVFYTGILTPSGQNSSDVAGVPLDCNATTLDERGAMVCFLVKVYQCEPATLFIPDEAVFDGELKGPLAWAGTYTILEKTTEGCWYNFENKKHVYYDPRNACATPPGIDARCLLPASEVGNINENSFDEIRQASFEKLHEGFAFLNPAEFGCVSPKIEKYKACLQE